MTNLTDQQIERYSRQLALSHFSGETQQRLLDSKVLVVGVGGLGSPAAFYLASAGVGHLGIVDNDFVELNNLQRQILHTVDNIGFMKVYSAKKTLQNYNPEIEITSYSERLTSENISAIIGDYDFVIDASDNFDTKYLINDTCLEMGIAYSHAGILCLDGQVMTVVPGRSACFRCLFPEPPEEALTCSQAGVLGAVGGVIGSTQALEAIKYITGIGTLLENRMLVFDGLETFAREVKVPRHDDCPACSKIVSQMTEKK